MPWLLAWEIRWTKKKFLCILSKDETGGIQITNVLTSVTKNVSPAELAYAEEEMQKTYERPKKYQVEILAKIKKKDALYGRDFWYRFRN